MRSTSDLLCLLRSTTGDYQPTWCWLRPRSYSVTLQPINYILSAVEHRDQFFAIWPLVHAMQPPANLLGCGWAELGTSRVGYGVRGSLSPFRPERIAQAG